MRPRFRAYLAGLTCAVAAAAVVFWLSNTSLVPKTLSAPAGAPEAEIRRSPPARPANVVIDPRQFEDSGFKTASVFTGSIGDAGSLKDLQDALKARGTSGIKATYRPSSGAWLGFFPDRSGRRADDARKIARAHLHVRGAMERLRPLDPDSPRACPGRGHKGEERAELTAILGILALRRGEVENCIQCVGPSSCIFPISRDAVHQNQEGSRKAVRWFTEYLASGQVTCASSGS